MLFGPLSQFKLSQTTQSISSEEHFYMRKIYTLVYF